MARFSSNWDWYCCLVLILCMTVSSGSYVSWRNTNEVNEKSNDLKTNTKRYGTPFRTNQGVMRYVKLFGQDVLIWRCKNTIQPYWDGKPIPLIELYCETLGSLSRLEWYHNGKPIELGGRFVQKIVPHFANGYYYSAWIDFKLRIYNATQYDSGIYMFRVYNLKREPQEEQLIYVDISEKKRKKSQPVGDYHDYGRITKSERKFRRRTTERDRERRGRKRLRKYRKNRRYSRNRLWNGNPEALTEPKM